MWGVIPAAGKGSRMEDYLVDDCKELISVAGRSMLLRTIDELRAADVEGIVVVTSPDKPAIALALEDEILHGDIELVEQPQPNGLVDALDCARKITGDTLLSATPDNLFIGHPCPSAELLEVHRKTGHTTIGVVQVVRPWGALLSDTGRVGDISQLDDGTHSISSILAKQKERPFPLDQGAWRCTGRMVVTPDFWAQSITNDVVMLDAMAVTGRLSGAVIDAAYVDVGIPAGFEYARNILN